MQTALIKQSHEDFWLQEGYLLCMQFQEGWVTFRITGREHSNIEPFLLVAALATGANLVAWNEVLDPTAANVRMLEPADNKWLNHVFWGVNHPKVRIFTQYQSRRDRNSLGSATRPITGNIGYVPGEQSPFEGPFSCKTELFIPRGKYPAYNALNPLADAMTNINMHFEVMRYSYQIITRREEAKPVLLGERRRRLYTVGGIDPEPETIPSWLKDLAGGPEALKWGRDVMEGRA